MSTTCLTHPETSPSSCLWENESHRVFVSIMAKKTAQIHAPWAAVVQDSSWARRKQEGVKLQGISPRKRFLSPLSKPLDQEMGGARQVQIRHLKARLNLEEAGGESARARFSA